MKFPDNDKDVAKTIFIVLAGVAAFCGIVFVQAVVTAYVFSTLWAWYMVPFFGMKELPLAFAFGISLIVSYFQPLHRGEDKRSLSEKFATAIAHPLVALLLGWLGTLFI